MRSTLPLVTGVLSLGLLAPLASASLPIIDVAAASSENLGRFSGTLFYNPTGPATGTLTVSLTNTSPAANGGFITGLAFAIDSPDPARSATLTSTDYSSFQNAPNQSAAPFGSYIGGAALGGNWLGGGSPAGGIPVGATGEFTFAVAASNAAALTEESFISDTSPWRFVVRFRGFADGGSDKVPGMIVPAPGAGALLGAAGLIALRRRRR